MEALSVTQCVQQLNSVLETQVICVEGEVQSFHISQGKWGFFCLKDKESLIECFFFAFRIRVPLEDGMTIRVVAVPGIHPKSGRFRLTVEQVEVVGEGALKQAFELLKKKLEGEGLFAPARKRPLPRFPERIGLIASQESAAYSDFLKILRERYTNLEVVVAHVAVQGPTAVPAIVGALRELSALTPPLDAIVITRGGGSLEDLMAFNDETLARELFRSSVPIVTAVGHERDSTIVDYVADVRASTPSNAAELLVPHRREVIGALFAYREQMESSLSQRVLLLRHDLDRIMHQYVSLVERQRRQAHVLMERVVGLFARLEGRGRESQSQLAAFPARLLRALETRLQSTVRVLEDEQRLIRSLHPERLLKRGYSIVRRQGRVVKSAADVQPHDQLAVTLSDGTVGVEVTSPQPRLL